MGERYDLSDRPTPGVMMSGGRKPVQTGVRVKLPAQVTWEQLAALSAEEIRAQDRMPRGFLPLPHVKHAVGGQVFPIFHIDAIQQQEARSLERFDVDFDLLDHLLPEFPPPIFLTTRPELGDVSQGQLLTIKNYYQLMRGMLTPVQIEGLRLLLTPFPQQQFNQAEDRKSEAASLGVTCLDCHATGHTNGAFHASQVAMMAQLQNMLDFPPAPKLNALGRLDAAKTTEEERLGEEIFFGKGQCGVCHPAPFYLDDKMHDPKVERFYDARMTNCQWVHAERPIKTFTLRGIKDSPPYLHDGRLLTLDDTVEFFNLILGLKLNSQDKQALVAFMRQL